MMRRRQLLPPFIRSDDPRTMNNGEGSSEAMFERHRPPRASKTKQQEPRDARRPGSFVGATFLRRRDWWMQRFEGRGLRTSSEGPAGEGEFAERAYFGHRFHVFISTLFSALLLLSTDPFLGEHIFTYQVSG